MIKVVGTASLRLEIAAGELAHQQLRGARAEIARIDGDGGQRGKRVLGFFDIVEADHREVSPDRDAGLRSARVSSPIATTSLKQRAAVGRSRRLESCGAAAPPPE